MLLPPHPRPDQWQFRLGWLQLQERQVEQLPREAQSPGIGYAYELQTNTLVAASVRDLSGAGNLNYRFRHLLGNVVFYEEVLRDLRSTRCVEANHGIEIYQHLKAYRALMNKPTRER